MWDLVEELLEDLIATTLSGLFALLMTKALLTFTIVHSGIKLSIKRIIKPFIKNLTYKGGNDKMAKIKAFFSKVGNAIKQAFKYVCISNPRASVSTLVNAFSSGILGIALDSGVIEDLPNFYVGELDLIPYAIAIVIFLITEFFGIKFAFEKNSTADERKLKNKAIKEEKKALKEKVKAEELAKKKELEEAKEIERLADEYEAKEKAEQEAKRNEELKQQKIMALIEQRKLLKKEENKIDVIKGA